MDTSIQHSVNHRLHIYLKNKYRSIRNAANEMDIEYTTLFAGVKSKTGSPSAAMLIDIITKNEDLDANWLIRGEEHGLVDEIRHLKLKLADQAEELGELKNIIVTDTSSDVYQQLEQIKEEINLIKKSQAK